jgi:hypothetical protein
MDSSASATIRPRVRAGRVIVSPSLLLNGCYRIVGIDDTSVAARGKRRCGDTSYLGS